MLVVCTGTGTEVGKTYVGAATLRSLRRAGVTVSARKPVQSFAADDPAPTDADVLAAATGEPATTVCPLHRRYEVPMAPPMAAAALGRPAFTIADLAVELREGRRDAELHWVESAGGVRSPLAADGDTVALCDAIQPDLVVLVADAGLGTINAVRLSCDALRRLRVTVVLNRYRPDDDLHRRNCRWLVDHDGITALTGHAELACHLRGLLAPAPPGARTP